MHHDQREAVEALEGAVSDLFSAEPQRVARARAPACTACDLLDPAHPGYLPDDGFVDEARTVDVDRRRFPDARGGAAILTTTFIYLHGGAARRRALAAPKGYVTDFTSVPLIFRWLIAQRGKHERAAIVHDWLYTLGPRAPVARAEADAIFRDALHDLGTPLWKCAILYTAVRVFGAGAFGARREWRFRDVDTQEVVDVSDEMQATYRAIGDCRRPREAA